MAARLIKPLARAYWKGWAILGLSLLLFVIGGPYWPAGIEAIQLPRRAEVLPEDTVQYVMLEVRVRPPVRQTAALPEAGMSQSDTSHPLVLLFGDSMIEWVRFRLARWLREIGYELYVVLWPSSNLIWWARSDTLSHLMKTLRPDYVLISIGGNELFIPNIERRLPYLERILQNIGNTPYVWIGPPNWAEDTGINALIARQVGVGHFFESRRLSFERLEDGAHPTPSSSYQWADSIAVYLRDSALVPLPLPEKAPQIPYLFRPRSTCFIPPQPPATD